VPILPQWRLASRDINALYAPGQSPKVRAFLDFLVGALAER
jgi:hypothetical protein